MKRLVMWMLALLMTASVGNAIADDVLLGAGDMLKISVYGNPDLALETRVSENGSITYPLVGEVVVAGLPTSGAEKKIAGLLESGGFLRKAQVNIVVTALQSQQVSILGQINRPGRYPIEGKRNLIDMLAIAGGVAPDGGEAITLIRTRNGKSAKRVVDVIDLVRTGSMEQNYDVESGDLIYVERAPRFYIYGEVQRPGLYRLEKSLTVLQALSSGGGLTARGTEKNIRIKRRDEAGKLQIIDAKHDDLVKADDVVYVKESLF